MGERLSPGFAQAFGEALRAQIAEPSEAGLLRAFRLGEAALADGANLLDLALVHHQALAQLLADAGPQSEPDLLVRAAGFLAEALSPFDMTLTDAREAQQQVVAERLERRRAEEALWQAQKHQAVGRLASGVAHHFSNLLTAILGNLELVRRSHGDDLGLTQRLDRASEAARRAVRLTRQLLTFSGRQQLRPDVFDPSHGLDDLIALFSGSLHGQILVETEIPAGLWPVRVDVSELELALLNLAINAGDAMSGQGRLRIAAANRSLQEERLGLAGDYLMIAVADDGPGIPADILPRVFDPFFTTKAVGVGSGLGLSQVLGFAHQCKGAVDIDSEPGCGATIRLFLPAAHGPAAAAEPPPAPAGVVLVVEDDADVAEITASMLDSHGFEVKLAHRGQLALDMVRRGDAIDLVLCGLGLGGGMDGLALAKALGATRPDLPVLLTLRAGEAAFDAEQLGVPVIGKPYRSGDLYRRIVGLLASPAA